MTPAPQPASERHQSEGKEKFGSHAATEQEQKEEQT